MYTYVFIYIYICMYVYNVHLHVYVHLHVCVHVDVCVYIQGLFWAWWWNSPLCLCVSGTDGPFKSMIGESKQKLAMQLYKRFAGHVESVLFVFCWLMVIVVRKCNLRRTSCWVTVTGCWLLGCFCCCFLVAAALLQDCRHPEPVLFAAVGVLCD